MSPFSVKVTTKSENRNRGIGKGKKPRAILRKTKTFNYVLHDLRAPSRLRLWAHKVLVKGKNRLSSTGTE